MFPPPAAGPDLNLHRCLRFLPHLNDDGGFFVAILRKVGLSSLYTVLQGIVIP